jgi:hypothetical protein
MNGNTIINALAKPSTLLQSQGVVGGNTLNPNAMLADNAVNLSETSTPAPTVSNVPIPYQVPTQSTASSTQNNKPAEPLTTSHPGYPNFSQYNVLVKNKSNGQIHTISAQDYANNANQFTLAANTMGQGPLLQVADPNGKIAYQWASAYDPQSGYTKVNGVNAPHQYQNSQGSGNWFVNDSGQVGNWLLQNGLPAVGMIGGGIVGSAGGPLGTVGGAAAGDAITTALRDAIQQAIGEKHFNTASYLMNVGKGGLEGGALAGGGELAGAALGGLGLAGEVAGSTATDAAGSAATDAAGAAASPTTDAVSQIANARNAANAQMEDNILSTASKSRVGWTKPLIKGAGNFLGGAGYGAASTIGSRQPLNAGQIAQTALYSGLTNMALSGLLEGTMNKIGGGITSRLSHETSMVPASGKLDAALATHFANNEVDPATMTALNKVPTNNYAAARDVNINGNLGQYAEQMGLASPVTMSGEHLTGHTLPAIAANLNEISAAKANLLDHSGINLADQKPIIDGIIKQAQDTQTPIPKSLLAAYNTYAQSMTPSIGSADSISPNEASMKLLHDIGSLAGGKNPNPLAQDIYSTLNNSIKDGISKAGSTAVDPNLLDTLAKYDGIGNKSALSFNPEDGSTSVNPGQAWDNLNTHSQAHQVLANNARAMLNSPDLPTTVEDALNKRTATARSLADNAIKDEERAGKIQAQHESTKKVTRLYEGLLAKSLAGGGVGYPQVLMGKILSRGLSENAGLIDTNPQALQFVIDELKSKIPDSELHNALDQIVQGHTFGNSPLYKNITKLAAAKMGSKLIAQKMASGIGAYESNPTSSNTILKTLSKY